MRQKPGYRIFACYSFWPELAREEDSKARYSLKYTRFPSVRMNHSAFSPDGSQSS